MLNTKEMDILTRHFGLGPGEPETLETIGQNHCPPISRERVRQIEERAMLKLNKARANRSLKPFLKDFRPEWDQSLPSGSALTEDPDELD
jgi:DNA-directed RNA polymerase sigma subunit (sigma70/sigma32)